MRSLGRGSAACQRGLEQVHESAPLDLGHVVARDSFDRQEADRNEDVLQMLRAVLAELRLIERGARHDQCMDFFDSKLIGYVEHGGIGDTRKRAEHLFHDFGVDLVAANVQQGFLAAGNDEQIVPAQITYVPRVNQPSRKNRADVAGSRK